ncbi:MAG: hypothetical protein P4L53_25515 [Candidatus Obscuribacterales bacterium]|nr:hypothetical protein [Candidatus Obscuribacterales bacterium]
MTKAVPNRKEILSRLAQLEILLSRLQDELFVCEHKNTVVQDCIDRADKTLKSAVQKLSRGDFETATHLANVVYLRLNFGRQLMVAEILESEIGESEFLQLTEVEAVHESVLTASFAKSDRIIREFIEQCKTKHI